MKNPLLIFSLFSIVFIHTAYAQNFNKAKLDSLFNLLAANDKAMGSVTLSKNGKVIYTKAIGFSNISDKLKTPANENTKYRVGSVSKMFTAAMIFQLIEEGKLKLTTTIDSYFPALPNAKKITVSNLLNHRSGLHDYTHDTVFTSYMTQQKAQDAMLALIANNKPDFEPNEKAGYSNSNYFVLGCLIEKITKQSYSKNLEQRITAKAKISNTYFGVKTNPAKNEGYSYQFADGWKQLPETDMSIPGGAGGIVSTPTDLTHFIETLFNNQLISKNSLAQMKTIKDKFGMGMFQIPFYNKTAYGHQGVIDGFAASVGYFPEDSLAIAYCTNGQVYPMNNILIGVLSIYYNKDYTFPTFKSIALNPEDLDKYLGLYSSKQIPLKISITKSNSTLMAQATGHPAFALEATEKDNFKFDLAGVRLEFHPDKNELTLKQGVGNYLFVKDK